jgi:hypothetical protein
VRFATSAFGLNQSAAFSAIHAKEQTTLELVKKGRVWKAHARGLNYAI